MRYAGAVRTAEGDADCGDDGGRSRIISAVCRHISQATTLRWCFPCESRQAQQEAIRAPCARFSHAADFRQLPVLSQRDRSKRLYSYVDKGDVTNWLIQVIRRYQPDMLITHASAADNIGMHQLTSTYAARSGAGSGRW
ncbi:MAG: hypothetical protein R2912_09615 [Eubacteriales bacterium]